MFVRSPNRLTARPCPLLPALLLLSGTLILASPTSAAVPGAMSAHGTLRAAGGGPVADGGYTATFALYEQAKGGKATWFESHNLTVKAGAFSAKLGLNKPLDAKLLAAMKGHWLGISVANEPELPRLALASTAFSLLAQSAASLDCSGCVGAGQLAAGAVAGKHVAPGAISADKVGFTYAGSKTKGGPADKAMGLACTGCVSVDMLNIDKDLDLGGNALKAKKISANDMLAQTVTASAFMGDGSKLTGLNLPAGSCAKAGDVVKGIAPDGKLLCTPGGAKLPADGLAQVSNGLLTNQFTLSWPGKAAPLDIPDNSPIGIFDELEVPDVGLAQKLTVHVKLSNSDIKDVQVLLFDPNNAKYVLYSKGGKGKGLDTAWPTPSKPISGDLGAWAGKNAKGKWRIRVIDDAFFNNGNDGKLLAWRVEIQTLSNKKVAATGDVEVNGTLKGPVQFKNAKTAPVKCSAGTTGYVYYNTVAQALEVCNGKTFYGINVSPWGEQDSPAPSCKELLAAKPTAKSGVYWLDPDDKGPVAPFQGYCEMKLGGGGWTLVAANSKTSGKLPGNGQGVVLTQGGLNSNPNPQTDYVIGAVMPKLKFSEALVVAWNGGKRIAVSHPADKYPYVSPGANTYKIVLDEQGAGVCAKNARYFVLGCEEKDAGNNANSNQNTTGICIVSGASGDPSTGTYFGHGSKEGSFEGFYNKACQSLDSDHYASFVR